MASNNNRSDLHRGLVLLLEAAEYHSNNMIMPPSHDEKRSLSSPPMKPVYCPLPPKKRIKLSFDNEGHAMASPRANPPPSSSLLKAVQLNSIMKASSKCSAGSSHRMWEGVETHAMAASLAHHFNSLDIAKPKTTAEQQQVIKVASENDKTFVLYDKDDDKHINALHNIIRRDIWEGFVVDTSKDLLDDNQSTARRTGRIARYEGTIGFRCRFCKNAPLNERAGQSAVYPRCLERIYIANIRFQRDHIG